MLPVGHGQAVLLRAGGTNVLVDAGSRLPSVAARRIVTSLGRAGVRHLDALVLSHEDADHCGAVAALLALVSVDRALVPAGFGGDATAEAALAALHDAGVPVSRIGRNDVHEWPSLTLRALHPRADRPGPVGNEGSLVLHARLLLDDGELSVLLPADVEGLALTTLARDPTLPRSDVLLLPHHGRGPPRQLRALARRVGARHLIASAATAADVSLRDVHVTGRDGTIHVDLDGLRTGR